jgi:hypothetical protein
MVEARSLDLLVQVTAERDVSLARLFAQFHDVLAQESKGPLQYYCKIPLFIE